MVEPSLYASGGIGSTAKLVYFNAGSFAETTVVCCSILLFTYSHSMIPGTSSTTMKN